MLASLLWFVGLDFQTNERTEENTFKDTTDPRPKLGSGSSTSLVFKVWI